MTLRDSSQFDKWKAEQELIDAQNEVQRLQLLKEDMVRIFCFCCLIVLFEGIDTNANSRKI